MVRNLLVIDDHEDSLYILKQLLLKNGIAQSVTTCRNGEEGIDYLEKSVYRMEGTVPDLILLNLDLPDLTGWKFLDEYVKWYHHQLPHTSLCITSSQAARPNLDRVANYKVPIAYVYKMNLFRDIRILTNVDALRPRNGGASWSMPHKEASVHPFNKSATDTHYPGVVPALRRDLRL